MSTETVELADELISAGFKTPAQKRGLFKWIIGLQFGFIVFLAVQLIKANDKATTQQEKSKEVLFEIIKMQNQTKEKVDSTIQKL